MVGTFLGEKSLKTLSNKVFRFIQQALLYSEKSVLATDCYDLTPLTYEERGMLPAKNPTENGFLEETRFLDQKLITFSLDLTLK